MDVTWNKHPHVPSFFSPLGILVHRSAFWLLPISSVLCRFLVRSSPKLFRAHTQKKPYTDYEKLVKLYCTCIDIILGFFYLTVKARSYNYKTILCITQNLNLITSVLSEASYMELTIKIWLYLCNIQFCITFKIHTLTTDLLTILKSLASQRDPSIHHSISVILKRQCI